MAKTKKHVKLPPPKKMSPKEAKAAAKRNSAAIQGKVAKEPKKTAQEIDADHEIIARAAKRAGEASNDKLRKQTKPVTKPRIKKTAGEALPKAYVFYDCHRHVYLLLTEGDKFNRYLTTGNDGFCVVKLEHGSPIRDDKGHLPEDTTRVGDLTVYEDYDLKKAVQKFHSSFLPRSNEAEREMCKILGKPMPEIPEAVKAVRKAAGERLQKARKERPQLTKPEDDALVTLIPDAQEQAPSKRAAKILKLLGGDKKGMTISELAERIGVPIYATVVKLAELGLVKVKK